MIDRCEVKWAIQATLSFPPTPGCLKERMTDQQHMLKLSVNFILEGQKWQPKALKKLLG